MRPFAPVCALGSLGLLFSSLLACSENELNRVEAPPTEDIGADLDVPPTVPPAPAVDDTPVEPIADAGPDRLVGTAALIDLDGSASYDPNGVGITAWSWSVLSAPTAIQITPDVMNPNFSTMVPGTYSFELTVQNDAGLWDATPATVSFIVQDDPVLEPVANAGPDQTVDEGDDIFLDGTASFDPQGLAPLSFAWQIVTRPAGSQAVLSSSSTATPAFQADVDGNYVIELAVANSSGAFDSTPDQVVIVVENQILPPVADAGMDINASTNTLVTLNGTNSSDPQGLNPLSYNWQFTTRPAGSTATLAQAGGATPTFTPDLEGAYVLELNVGNSAGLWDLTPDKVDVLVTQAVVVEPVAQAGADFGVLPLETVQLDGTGSYDPSGLDPLVYQWTLVAQPSGSTTVLNNTQVAQPSFFADLAGVYQFELTVMNTDGTWDTTPDALVIEAIPVDGFYVEVSWDNNNDLDLHILDGNAALWSDGDANYCNLNPSWGPGGAADDPSLDADAIYGYGPETTTIDAPSAGEYHINVHYYGLDGAVGCGAFSSCPSSVATVKVYLGGALAQTFTRTMDSAGQVWDVASISWPTGTITTVDSMGTTSNSSCN